MFKDEQEQKFYGEAIQSFYSNTDPDYSFSKHMWKAGCDYSKEKLIAIGWTPPGEKQATQAEPVGEFAGWQRRYKHPSTPGQVCGWESCSTKEATDRFEKKPAYEYRKTYAHPAHPVRPDELRQAALIDLAYINGAKAGWNMCVADDESQFKKLTEGVVECVKVLKNTRSHQTDEPVNEQTLSELKKMVRAYVRLLEAGKDRIESLGGDCDPVDRMEASDSNLRTAKAAIAAAEAAKGGE